MAMRDYTIDGRWCLMFRRDRWGGDENDPNRITAAAPVIAPLIKETPNQWCVETPCPYTKVLCQERINKATVVVKLYDSREAAEEALAVAGGDEVIAALEHYKSEIRRAREIQSNALKQYHDTCQTTATKLLGPDLGQQDRAAQ